MPIYGCGYNTDESRVVWGFEPLSPDLQLWQKTVSPESHAPYIRCPVLWLNSTNDFHGWLDFGQETLRAVPSTTRAAYSPNTNHHIRAVEAVSLVAWMDRTLRNRAPIPAVPRVVVDLDDNGIPRCRVEVDREQPIDRVEVFYALGPQPSPNRFWRCVAGVRDGQSWEASLPVMNTWQPIHVFANVYDTSPLCLSSNLVSIVPSRIGIARATLEWSATLNVEAAWRYQHSHTDPSIERRYLLPYGKDPSALRMNPELFSDKVPMTASSNYVADPQFAGRRGTVLEFTAEGNYPGGLSVALVSNNWTPRSKTFIARRTADEFDASNGLIQLALAQFQTTAGEPLPSWESADTIRIETKAAANPPPAIHSFRWRAANQ